MLLFAYGSHHCYQHSNTADCRAKARELTLLYNLPKLAAGSAPEDVQRRIQELEASKHKEQERAAELERSLKVSNPLTAAYVAGCLHKPRVLYKREGGFVSGCSSLEAYLTLSCKCSHRCQARTSQHSNPCLGN